MRCIRVKPQVLAFQKCLYLPFDCHFFECNLFLYSGHLEGLLFVFGALTFHQGVSGCLSSPSPCLAVSRLFKSVCIGCPSGAQKVLLFLPFYELCF